ncbi:hypothetical protein BASA60_011456 [Batrachochytrium salamandrivorans]|nr:hypothetical protein BASA60_011456 [Batrachochytrium salamandrivorans]
MVYVLIHYCGVLPHFVTHYAGQTTQGDTDDGDGANQSSGSKDAPKKVPRLPLRVHSLRLKRPLHESNTPDQNDASSSADLQPKKVCKGGYWLRNTIKSCSQQQSPPEPQSSTLYGPPQSDEMPLPAYVGKLEAESYRRGQNTEQYNAFTKMEARYFASEYSRKRRLGEGDSGVVYLATRKSDGRRVAYKYIPKSEVDKYALESSPPHMCHLRNHLVRSDEPSVEQCMSSRPPNLFVPHEFLLQMYLSRPGHENPYVPEVFDYYILEDEYILVMEYIDEDWLTLFKYVKKKGLLDIETVSSIVKEIVNGMIYLKQYGVLHRDPNGKVKVIDFGITNVLPGWEEGKPFPSKLSNPPSPASGYKAGYYELESIHTLGKLLYMILTEMDPYTENLDHGSMLRKTLFPDSDTYKSGLKEKAIDLISALVSRNTDIVPSIEAILEHSFFN